MVKGYYVVGRLGSIIGALWIGSENDFFATGSIMHVSICLILACFTASIYFGADICAACSFIEFTTPMVGVSLKFIGIQSKSFLSFSSTMCCLLLGMLPTVALALTAI